MQKHSPEERKAGKPEALVGCGPFKLVEWVKGTHLVMDRFDKYFEPGLPYLDRVVIRTIKDPVTQLAAFKAGEIDFIADFSADHVDTLRAQNPRAQVMTGKETTPMVAMMKVTVPADGKPMSKNRGPHPIFGDIRVRKAVACYGIDRNEIVKIAYKGRATPWVGIIPPGTIDTVDVNHMCPYDPAKAKALLAEAGHGPQKPLTFELMTNSEKSVFSVIATVIKEQMARIGVTANIRLVDKPSWLTTATQDGVFDMYVEDLASLLTVDQNSYLVGQLGGLEQCAPHRYQDRRLLHALRPRDGSCEAQGHRQRVAGVQRRQALLEHDLRLTVLPGGAAVDEGLRLPGRVQDRLQESLARQIGSRGSLVDRRGLP